MRNFFKILTSCAVIIAFASGCTPPSIAKPELLVSKQTVKVGETILVTLQAPTQIITGENYNIKHFEYGFIYTPTVITAPNTDDIVGPYAGSGSQNFPLNPSIELATTNSTIKLTPALTMLAIRDGSMSRTTFEVRAISVGKAIIRGGFLSRPTPDGQPVAASALTTNCCLRQPFLPWQDAEIVVEVVP